MSQKITLEFLATQAGMLKEIQKLHKKLDETSGKMDKLERTSRRSSKAGADGFGEMKKSVGQVATVLGGVIGVAKGVQLAIAAINSELNKTVAIQTAAQRGQQTAGQALRDLKINFTDTPEAALKLEKDILAIAERTKSEVAGVAQVAGGSFSASSLSNAETLKFVEAAFQFMPNNPEAAAELSSRGLDLAKATGNKDPRKLIGALVGTQSAARVESLSQLGQTVTNPVNTSVLRGDTAEQGLEMFATITQLLSDKGGRFSGTAQIALAEQLSGFSPLDKFKGPTAKLAELQRNPELANLFLKGGELDGKKFTEAAFENKASGGIEALIRNTETARRVQENSARKILPLAQSGQLFEEKLAVLNEGEFQPTVSRGLAVSSAGRSRSLADRKGALIGESRAILKQIIEGDSEAGIAPLDLRGIDPNPSRMFEMTANTNPEDAPAFLARRYQQILDNERTVGLPGDRGTQVRSSDRAYLEEMVRHLEDISKEMKTVSTNSQTGKGAGTKPAQPAAAINSR